MCGDHALKGDQCSRVARYLREGRARSAFAAPGVAVRGPPGSLSNVLVNKDRVSARVNCDKTGGSRGGLIGFEGQRVLLEHALKETDRVLAVPPFPPSSAMR